jgi:hypothetical protein
MRPNRDERPILLALAPALMLAGAIPLAGQTRAELQQILERLDRLEQENQALREAVRELQAQRPVPKLTEKGEAGATVEERIEIAERRISEQAQSKVEAAQRFPVRLTGMAVVNTYLNSKQNGNVDYPTSASLGRGTSTGGATWRQSILGLDYQGGRTVAGGTVRGEVSFDFFGGVNQPLGHLLRLRTASIGLDWKSTSVSFVQDKPIISPRNPDSIAQIGVSPLTGAGNLWLWVPQFRFEQRVTAGESTQFSILAGVMQTNETSANTPAAFTSSLERFRPGYEGRLEWAQKLGAEARVEIAPGIHYSSTHVAGISVPSSVLSVDWLVSPAERIELTGMYFQGKNVAHFGGLRQGFTVLGYRSVIPVRSQGGWSQLALRATDRLTFHLMAGKHDDRNNDLRGGVAQNLALGGNFYYKLAPNLILSLEALQLRTQYLGSGQRLNNHYDLGFAYLF